MLRNHRYLTLDVFDYNGNKICPLYDSTIDPSGQAVNVFVTTKRNGWKELSFTIPSTCKTADGEEENYRLEYLISDYRVRLVDDKGVDWFLLSEPKINHKAFSKDVQVTAGHISQLLKTKNLGLEFSDEAGNNVGTAEQLLATILDGTGWSVGHVAKFFEKDGITEKIRSMKASAKTGAFSLITKMCDLFEAKPIFHGEGRIVDIVPLNPFSRPVNGEMPDLSDVDDVVELYYGRNIKNVVRQVNTENLITKLYAYGSFGDDVTGYCGVDEIEFRIARLTLGSRIPAGQTFYFSVLDDTGIEVTYNFTASEDIEKSDILKLSFYDRASLLYLWNENTEKAIRIHKGVNGNKLNATVEYGTQRNYFSFIMDYSYYDDVGLLTDEAVSAIAQYQQRGAVLQKNTLDKSAEMNSVLQTLSETIGSVDFCKLNVTAVASGPNGHLLTLTGNPDDLGVIYRTDYDAIKRDRFKWYASTGIKPTGESLNSEASVLYIAHNTNPITWNKVYLKKIESNADNIVLTLWTDDSATISTSDDFFLFATNSVNGYLGAYETADESAVITLENAVKVVTTNHPVYFSKTSPIISSKDLNGYGWWCKYSDDETVSELYFCYSDLNDNGWNKVVVSDQKPLLQDGTYWYDWKKVVLYRNSGSDWVELKAESETSGVIGDVDYSVKDKVVESFSSVYRYMLTRDKYYKGQYQKLTHTASSAKPLGNYYIKDIYNHYYVFTTTSNLASGDSVTYNTTENHVVQNVSGNETIIEMKTYRFDSVKYHPENVCETGLSYSDGGFTSSFLPVYPSTTYLHVNIPTGTKISYFNKKNNPIGQPTGITGNGSFSTPENVWFIKLEGTATEAQMKSIRIYYQNYATAIIAEDETYEYIGSVVGSGELKGIIPLMQKFVDNADEAYIDKYQALKAAQEEFKQLENSMIELLGDLYREGYWQKTDYVNGDEQKLFDDAVENLDELAKPDVSYNISYLDRYSSVDDYVVESTTNAAWPDLSIMSAAHLVDPEININCWAYFDEINKCYDQPQKTTIKINTKMSTIGQHSFTDVMTHIANVAQEVKGKESIYSRAAALTGSGQLAAERLQGVIDANKLLITGGSSTWYTDNRGNIVFVSSDGSSAMTLTGNGFAIANSKDVWGDWNWRTFGTGDGFSADEITTGYLSAERIEAGSIVTDHLHASVGQELNISSNKALSIFATTDGQKPAGSVLTDGSIIEVKNDKINVASSGSVNLTGADVNVSGSGSVNVSGGSGVNVASDGTVNINGGAINVVSNGKINLTSGTLDIKSGGKISVTSAESIVIGTGTLQGNLNTLQSNIDDKYTIVNGIGINEDGVVVSGKTIKLLTSSGVAGNIYLGNANNVLTSSGVLSLSGGNILLDGPNNTVTIGNGGGTVNIGTSGNGTINLANYKVVSDTATVSYASKMSTSGITSSSSSSKTLTWKQTDSDGTEKDSTFTISYNYSIATINKTSLPSIQNGQQMEFVYQDRGLSIYADTTTDKAILTPSVTDGHLLGWHTINAQNVGATNLSATTLCSDNIYMGTDLVATQKWSIEMVSNILADNSELITGVKSRADSAYWKAAKKPVLNLSDNGNGSYTLSVTTGGGTSESVNFNKAAIGNISLRATGGGSDNFTVECGTFLESGFSAIKSEYVRGKLSNSPYSTSSYVSLMFGDTPYGQVRVGDVYTAGFNSVTVSAGSWANGSCRITASNGKYVNVSIPNVSMSQGSWISGSKLVSAYHGSSGQLGSTTVSLPDTASFSWSNPAQGYARVTVTIGGKSYSDSRDVSSYG